MRTIRADNPYVMFPKPVILKAGLSNDAFRLYAIALVRSEKLGSIDTDEIESFVPSENVDDAVSELIAAGFLRYSYPDEYPHECFVIVDPNDPNAPVKSQESGNNNG